MLCHADLDDAREMSRPRGEGVNPESMSKSVRPKQPAGNLIRTSHLGEGRGQGASRSRALQVDYNRYGLWGFKPTTLPLGFRLISSCSLLGFVVRLRLY